MLLNKIGMNNANYLAIQQLLLPILQEVLQAGDMIDEKKDLIFERAKVSAHNPKIDKFKV